MKNLESFGSLDHYKEVITLVKDNKWQWRKVANLLNNIRRDLRPWDVVDRDTQKESVRQYIRKALKDTKLPAGVMAALKLGINREFGYRV